ncbi:MAG: ABC-type antimicrobial peptide transport system, permease component [Bacteroidetes bacterium]|jgi:putative ABC transport system permease protein|nr:ABC-type antimicrobial peptide transport system, permease component [Bacteroidota bacterium]
MFDRDNWQEIFATIRKNRLRTALTMLGVLWGIFMLVVMLGCGNGLKNGVTGEFGGTATNSFFCWTQQTTKAYKGMKPGRSFNYDNSDYEALKQLKELKVVCPMNQLGGHDEANNVIRGLKTGAAQVQGTYPSSNEIQKVFITSGRYINENDIRENRKVCVIGSRVFEMLFKSYENPLGQYIQINGVYFKVIGMSKPLVGGNDGREQAQRIVIPFTTFQKAFNYGDVVGWFAINSQDNFPAVEAEQKVMAVLKDRHKIAPEDLRAIGHWNMAEEFGKMSGLFFGIEILIWIVGGGTLFAGVIGISNIMLIVVKERTKEIGVKRALGATPFQIIFQIMLESLFLTAIAGYMGLCLGIGVLELVNSSLGQEEGSMFKNPTVDLAIAVKALIILIVSGTIAGAIPARKAVAILPVEALRAE